MQTIVNQSIHGWQKFLEAYIAQLVERILGKDEVFGPIPNVGSSILEAWTGCISPSMHFCLYGRLNNQT